MSQGVGMEKFVVKKSRLKEFRNILNNILVFVRFSLFF